MIGSLTGNTKVLNISMNSFRLTRALRTQYRIALSSALVTTIAAFAQNRPGTVAQDFPVAAHIATLRPSDQSCAIGSQANARWRKEVRSGRKLAAKLEQNVALIEDREIISYLNRLEQNIVLHAGFRQCFIVRLINDVETNALSLPGGFIYVTSGLIMHATNEAELVAALAHETGHVTARHLTKIEKQKKIWQYSSLAGGLPGYIVGQGVGRLFMLKSVRKAEFEADRLAVQYQSASGYDPLEFTRLLQDEFGKEGPPAPFFGRLLDEHPLTQTRILRIDRERKSSPPPPMDYVVDTSEFHEIKGKIAALMGIANPELNTTSP